MRLSAGIFLICILIGTSACSGPSTNQTSQTNQPSPPAGQSPAPNSPMTVATPAANETPGAIARAKVDACTLLTSAEIAAVQGEPVKETKASNRVTGDFIVTQCYYELPTLSNSISLTLTESNSDKKGADSVKEYWERTFGRDEKKSESERKRERDEEKKKEAKPESRREGEEEEESAPMEPVKGVGDEAFWSASRVGGALYALKQDQYIRISVGGKGDANAKLKKSKTLALKALRRLSSG
jgi:hypothetical protein